jgi:OFA family oxalate/formate antiporter-like MFS transporter
MMVWKGTDEETGAILLGAIALMTVPLRLFLGWAGDRISRARIIAAGNIIGAVALLFLQFAEPGWQLWVFVVLFTFPESIGPIGWNLLADYYGRKRYASIRGIMSAFTGIASAIVPVLAGYLYDTTKSYSITIWIMMTILALSAVVFLVLRPPRPPDRLMNSVPSDTPVQSASH